MSVIAASTYFLLGLMLGWYVGATLDWHPLQIRRAHMPTMRGLMRHLDVALLVAILALFLTSGALAWQYAQVQSYAAYVECKAAYDARFAVTYRQRAETFEGFAESMDDIVDAILTGTPKDTRAALEEYRRVREQQNAALDRTPPPPTPRDACGTPEGGPSDDSR